MAKPRRRGPVCRRVVMSSREKIIRAWKNGVGFGSSVVTTRVTRMRARGMGLCTQLREVIVE